jgi:hypothetical protein
MENYGNRISITELLTRYLAENSIHPVKFCQHEEQTSFASVKSENGKRPRHTSNSTPETSTPRSQAPSQDLSKDGGGNFIAKQKKSDVAHDHLAFWRNRMKETDKANDKALFLRQLCCEDKVSEQQIDPRTIQ